jgi:S1-C subfamily serine protease
MASLGGLAGLLCAAPAAAQGPNRAAFIALAGSVVRVEVDRDRGGLALGTGVTVGHGIVVTNCHVLRDGSSVRISGAGRRWEVSAEHANTLHDVCFLRVPSWGGQPVPIGSTDGMQPGETVAALGFTGGAGISLRLGRVIALHALDGGRVIESDSAFTSGASGGGLFNAGGALVGLLTFRKAASGGAYFSLPVEWIVRELPADNEWTEVGPIRGAAAFWQGDADSLPSFMRDGPRSSR